MWMRKDHILTANGYGAVIGSKSQAKMLLDAVVVNLQLKDKELGEFVNLASKIVVVIYLVLMYLGGWVYVGDVLGVISCLSYVWLMD